MRSSKNKQIVTKVKEQVEAVTNKGKEEICTDCLSVASTVIAALGGKTTKKPEMTDEQFKLPDLVATKEGEEMFEEERELLKPLPKPSIKLRTYPCKWIDTEKIKLGAAMQREQQKQRAEELLQQDIEVT